MKNDRRERDSNDNIESYETVKTIGHADKRKESEVMKIKRKLVIYCLLFSMLLLQMKPVKVHAKTGEVAGIEETTAYYIKNVASGLYLEYNPNNDNVRVGNFTGAQNQRWAFRLKTNDNYVIVPRGNTEYRLDVHSGTGAQNANIDICPSSNGTDQEWHGHRNGNGTYMFKSSCSGYTRFLSAAGVTAGSNVVQSTAYPDNQRNWTLEKVTKGRAFQATVNITGNIDTTPAVAILDTYGKAMGYPIYQLINTSAATAYGHMNNDIWIFNAHGNPCILYFHSASYADLGYIVAANSQIEKSSDRAVETLAFNALSANRCTLLLACKAGLSRGSYNLVDEIYGKGAKFVLGPIDDRYPISDNIWLEAFLKASLEKKTVAQAMAAADVASPNSSHYYYKGNSYQKLNP